MGTSLKKLNDLLGITKKDPKKTKEEQFAAVKEIIELNEAKGLYINKQKPALESDQNPELEM